MHDVFIALIENVPSGYSMAAPSLAAAGIP
jgi:hypothetical protein